MSQKEKRLAYSSSPINVVGVESRFFTVCQREGDKKKARMKAWVRSGFQLMENPIPSIGNDKEPGANPEDERKPFAAEELAKMQLAAPCQRMRKVAVACERCGRSMALTAEHAKNMSEVFSSVRNACLHKSRKENPSLISRKLCVRKSKLQIRLTGSPDAMSRDSTAHFA
jgi:hypothetical protein